MQNHSFDNTLPHANLSEIPTLIEADIEQGYIEVNPPLPGEKGSARIHEAEAKAYYRQGLKAQTVEGEQHLIETEAALTIAIQASEDANKNGEAQGHPEAEFAAMAYLEATRNALEKQRLDLADLRVALEENCPEENGTT